MSRYEVHHAVMSDPGCQFLASIEAHSWPTLLIVGPDGRELLRLKGEHKEERIISFLQICFQALIDGSLNNQVEVPWTLESLSQEEIPIMYEKDKLAQASSNGLIQRPELSIARRQNLNSPGKVFYYRTKPQKEKPLPYEGVTELLVIADSGHNRYILINASVNIFVDRIGSGQAGYRDGSFEQAQFDFPQGVCHYFDRESGDHCLLLCDVKNHCVRKANLRTRQVTRVVGVPGFRGQDKQGGKV